MSLQIPSQRGHQPLGYLDSITSNRCVSRVKFVAPSVTGGVDTPYDGATTIGADLDITPNLKNKTASELISLISGDQHFVAAQDRYIYRYHSGPTSSVAIPLAKVNKLCSVSCFGIVTEAFSGGQTLSVGIPGDTGYILDDRTTAQLAIPSGGTTAIWAMKEDYLAASTGTSATVACGVPFYYLDRLIAPGTTIYLYVSNGAGDITGDITFEFSATAVGGGTYQVFDGNSTKPSAQGRDWGVVYPVV